MYGGGCSVHFGNTEGQGGADGAATTVLEIPMALAGEARGNRISLCSR